MKWKYYSYSYCLPPAAITSAAPGSQESLYIFFAKPLADTCALFEGYNHSQVGVMRGCNNVNTRRPNSRNSSEEGPLYSGYCGCRSTIVVVVVVLVTSKPTTSPDGLNKIRPSV